MSDHDEALAAGGKAAARMLDLFEQPDAELCVLHAALVEAGGDFTVALMRAGIPRGQALTAAIGVVIGTLDALSPLG